MTTPRNYHAEARAILDGASSRIAEKEHLVALDEQLAAMNRNIITLGEVLLAVLNAHGVPGMQVPPDVLATIRQQRTMPVVHLQSDGSIVVTVMPLAREPQVVL